jgi:hypothetical protein
LIEMRNKFLVLSSVLIFLNSCVDPLNKIRSDGFVEYKNNGLVSCLYFDTEYKLKPFINSLCKDIGLIQYSDSTTNRKILGWKNVKVNSLTESVDLEISVMNLFVDEEGGSKYDKTNVTIVVFGNTKNLIDSNLSGSLIEYFQNKINSAYQMR